MALNQSQIVEILGSAAFFSSLSKEELQAFAKDVRVQKCQNKEQLFLHGDEADAFYVVAKGWVKLFRETIDGKESLINLVSAYETFGEEVISENTRYPYGAEIVDDATLLALPLEIIRKRLENDGKLAFKMLGALAKHMSLMETQLEQLMVMTAPKRIGCFILKLTREKESGSTNVTLPYDKSLIASKLGMQAETFSRAMKSLGKVGVTVKESVVSISDIAKLRDYVCQSCSNPTECDEEKKQHCQHLCVLPPTKKSDSA